MNSLGIGIGVGMQYHQGGLLDYNLLKADTTMFKADRTLSLTIENENTNVREQFILLNERFTELYQIFNLT